VVEGVLGAYELIPVSRVRIGRHGKEKKQLSLRRSNSSKLRVCTARSKKKRDKNKRIEIYLLRILFVDS